MRRVLTVLSLLLGQVVVGINSWVAHANTSVFGPDAKTFRPERWLESAEQSAKMERYFIPVSRLLVPGPSDWLTCP